MTANAAAGAGLMGAAEGLGAAAGRSSFRAGRMRYRLGAQGAPEQRSSRNQIWPIVALGALGFLFPGQLHLVMIPLAAVVVWAVWSRANESDWSRPMLVAVTVGVFVVGTVLRDVVVPPVAACSDGSYSYTSTNAGPCSAAGGVKQWMPAPWWMQ